jgi:hypothetical protein
MGVVVIAVAVERNDDLSPGFGALPMEAVDGDGGRRREWPGGFHGVGVVYGYVRNCIFPKSKTAIKRRKKY